MKHFIILIMITKITIISQTPLEKYRGYIGLEGDVFTNGEVRVSKLLTNLSSI